MSLADLPASIPIFPLPGVAVMPGSMLPLNIFEPRYLAMVFDVLGSHRMIGMVQPVPDAEDEPTSEVFGTGSAGRITSFSETRDGRLMLVLTGVCRFDIREELSGPQPYRRVIPDWTRFESDYRSESGVIADRDNLFSALRTYCERASVEIAWKDAEALADQSLIDLLTVHLPLPVEEKQALIESVTLRERADLLQGFIDLTNARDASGRDIRH